MKKQSVLFNEDDIEILQVRKQSYAVRKSHPIYTMLRDAYGIAPPTRKKKEDVNGGG